MHLIPWLRQLSLTCREQGSLASEAHKYDMYLTLASYSANIFLKLRPRAAPNLYYCYYNIIKNCTII